MVSFTITPLTDHTGAEVIGLNFTRPIDIETRAMLKCGSMQAPLFRRFSRSGCFDDGSGRARFAFGLLAARDIECMVDAIESAVAAPQY
jgi:hypothetical protein